jgi:hypothetical protein
MHSAIVVVLRIISEHDQNVVYPADPYVASGSELVLVISD